MTEESEGDSYRAKRELEQFINLALHDLRSPLNSSSALAQILMARFGEELNEEGQWIAEQIVVQQKRMGDLVTGISAFINATASKAAPAAVELAQVIDKALHNLEAAGGETIAQVDRAPMPSVFGRERELVEVFQILIRNSIQYKSDEPSRIVITATSDRTSCTVCLRDNGIGFEPEFQKQIFEPFKRLHGTQVPGAGLGLSICKKIVEAHHGRVWAESQSGQGAAFYLTLPLAAV